MNYIDKVWFFWLGLTIFLYLIVPLMVCSSVFNEKKYVRYTRIVIINAILVFIAFSVMHFFVGDGIANPTGAIFWSAIAFFVCRRKYDKKQTICPKCKKPSPGEFCTHCGAKLKEEPLTASEKNTKAIAQGNCIVRLDLNQIETEYTGFEVYMDDIPHFISCAKDTGFNLPLGNHQVSYKHRLSKIPVLNFTIGENEVVRIVCSLVDKSHITANVTDRLPKAVEPETSASSETI